MPSFRVTTVYFASTYHWLLLINAAEVILKKEIGIAFIADVKINFVVDSQP